MRILLFGPQGAGKGTIGAMMVDKYGIPLIGTGQMLRDAIKEETELGKTAKGYMDKGNLVPAELVAGIVNERVQKENKGYILDGFPRNLEQAEMFDQMDDVDYIIVFEVPKDMSLYRLSGRRTCKECGAVYNVNPDGFPHPKEEGRCDKCGGELIQRDDDKPEAIEQRLKTYQRETKPILERYKHKVFTLDATLPVDQIFEKTTEIIDKKEARK
ncbi:adenylate kinase [Candidatus Woesearchaeota archaeon]|nr:adenylate kinase [Candidatus Woesearchaeota archaeon]